MNNDLHLNSLIQEMAKQHNADLPSPGVIWWRAQLLKKMEAKKRVERPMVVMRMLAAVIGLAATAWLAVNYRGDFAGGVSFSGSLFPVCLLAFGFLVICLIAGLRESTS